MKKLTVVLITVALLASSLFAVFPVQANISFQDGFESGDFSSWSGTQTSGGETATVVSTTVHHGSYGAKFTSNGGSSSESAFVMYNVSASELYARSYIYVSASGVDATDDRFYVIEFKSGSDRVAAIGWRNNTNVLKWTLIIRDGTGNTVKYSSNSPTVNTWYCVELHWKESPTAGLGELWVDNASVCRATGKNTSAYGNLDTVHFGFGELINCAASTMYTDCEKIKTEYIGTSCDTPSYLFQDGYESGNFSKWNGTTGSPAVQNATKHHGSYAMRADAAESSYLTIDESTVNMRAYFYVDSASGTAELMRFRAGSTNMAVLARACRTNGSCYYQLIYRNGSSLVYDTSATAFSLDTWNCIEMMTTLGDSGSFNVWVNGTELSDLHNTGIDNNNYGNLTRVNIGCTYTAGTIDVYVDCAAMTFNGEVIGADVSEYVILKCEFHIHTNASDGVYSPSMVVQTFYDCGYNVIAITDHNTMNGVAEAQAKGKELNMIVISGEEISDNWTYGEDKHIIALFVSSKISINASLTYTPQVEGYFNEVHRQGGIAYAAHPFYTNAYTSTTWQQYQNASFIDGWAYQASNWGPWNVTLFNEYNNFTLNTGKLYPADHDFHGPTPPSDTYYTLIMAHNRTTAGVREALDAKRMVVYDNGKYYGTPWALSLYQQLITEAT